MARRSFKIVYRIVSISAFFLTRSFKQDHEQYNMIPSILTMFVFYFNDFGRDRREAKAWKKNESHLGNLGTLLLKEGTKISVVVASNIFLCLPRTWGK